VNTASKQLLTYVSGLNATIAENIVKFRNERGRFKSRRDLMEVPRLGEKTFEQAAGFLRVRGATTRSTSRPSTPRATRSSTAWQGPRRHRQGPDAGRGAPPADRQATYVTDTIGLPTLTDILASWPSRAATARGLSVPVADGINKIENVMRG
jgi:uncharacterized protein